MSAHRAVRRKPRLRTIAPAAALLFVLGFAAFTGYWYATGGRWLIVQTPSMGRSAPVGTLLWVEPTDDLHVGDIISFHPPGNPQVTYTHRIDVIAADGTITTQGDGNAVADPWRLHRSDVTGVVAMRWWAVGWLVRAAPVLIIGGLLLAVLVRRFTAVRWKLPATTVGLAALAAVAICVYRPLMRAQLVVFEHVGAAHHAAQATYVSTGLLPVRLTAAGARPVVLNNGEFGTVVADKVGPDGRFTATVDAALTWWMWAALVLICFVPALWSVAVGLSPDRAAVRGKIRA